MTRDEAPPPPDLSAEQIRALRTELKLSQKDLAAKLGVEVSLVAAWEKGVAFPTLESARCLEALRAGQPLPGRGKRPAVDPLRGLLSDPEFWAVHRKLLAHRDLFEQVRKLARGYSDPGEPSG
jgi:transcriptional regulator with XRE-family HTH domain